MPQFIRTYHAPLIAGLLFTVVASSRSLAGVSIAGGFLFACWTVWHARRLVLQKTRDVKKYATLLAIGVVCFFTIQLTHATYAHRARMQAQEKIAEIIAYQQQYGHYPETSSNLTPYQESLNTYNPKYYFNHNAPYIVYNSTYYWRSTWKYRFSDALWVNEKG